jgi:hypothetical protein
VDADARLPRESQGSNTIGVPAYTDLHLHDITDPADPNAGEPLDLSRRPGSEKFFKGNHRF